MRQSAESNLLRCQCGAVECVGRGAPIGTAVCYCDDCQAAARELEALPGAPPLMDPDGGTALTLFRSSRFEVTRGADKLEAHKLRADSATSRMLATCCNSTMFLAFDKGPHWVSTVRSRFVGEKPPIQFRHMTKFRTSTLPYPDAVQTYPKFPIRFLGRVLGDWIAMKLGR
jgi:hypothetical protein